MTDYKFSIPIQVRYADLDPQWHVNNARFLSYIEQSRFAYIIEMGLWNGKSFLDLGLIVANMNIAFLAPIEFNMDVRVYARISRLGNKSMIFEHEIKDERSGTILGRAETVMVHYDYHTLSSQPIPDAWREKISNFEGISPRS